MIWFRRALFATLLVAVAVFLHWSLPSHDVVRILNTEVVRMNVETTDAQGRAVTVSRDLRLINAAKPSGAPRVYRNEDTGWGWPPYFKFDSANLAARAADMASTAEAPRWVIVTHYGMRLTWFSAFPNALGIRPTDNPDQYVIPWIKIVALVVVLGGLVLIRRRVLSWLGVAG